jgi:hypothetical protein
VIADGVFTDDVESIITDFAKSLSKLFWDTLPWQVGIQFFSHWKRPGRQAKVGKVGQ